MPPPPKEYEGSVARKRGAESPSESVPSKSRWESDDDDDDSDDDHPSRASTRTKLTHRHSDDEEEKVRPQARQRQERAVGAQARPVLVSCALQQPPARAVKKHVHWGTPEVHLAIFDEGDGIGFIRSVFWRG